MPKYPQFRQKFLLGRAQKITVRRALICSVWVALRHSCHETFICPSFSYIYNNKKPGAAKAVKCFWKAFKEIYLIITIFAKTYILYRHRSVLF